jgi:adenylylsulfate kinase-like enzyme
VLWICGTVAAGKSTAAWRLFQDLTASGHAVAYVDIDQLGMLYPDDETDPEGHALKCAALDALVPGYVGAGAEVLVVSGVVDPHRGPTLTADVNLTLCLLSPDPVAVRQRILDRGWEEAVAEEAEAENALLQAADFVHVVIDSAGLSVADTASQLRGVVGGASRPAAAPGAMPASEVDLDVVVITGPRAVGTSTVAFGLAMRRWRANRKTGFLDLQQLGFLSMNGRPATDVDLPIGQTAAMHRLMAARGAELLVVSGHLTVSDRAVMERSLPKARVTVVRLRADEMALREHVCARARGSDARLAGDDLLSSSREHQDLVVATAVAEQATLDATSIDDAVLDVSGKPAEETITEVEALIRRDCEPSDS